ncbi:hypothetical protein K3G39_07050 [Pontibacter sp. HSC-14F20]|uniref:hypothetical protein n=1 Tax=Pontibacter sp. HSC-14F20 TaxID=2864136 RepID=UPI001C73BA43|nr:hypothetical protein [Pontibacter sp. HSC-14F20]MBX0332991.1 hypothetical protein [Pontibacter sp. HSC-14F20]
MPTKEDKPYPDTWHVITYDNEHRSGKSKRMLKDSNAKYYIRESYSYHNISASAGNRYDFNEFKVYDESLKPVKIEEGGVILIDFTTEFWDRSGFGTKQVGFTIQDKVGVQKKEWVKLSGIYSFKHCIEVMQHLSNYYSWDEYDLAQKVEKQSSEILNLKIENRRLKRYKEQVEEVKDNIKKLHRVLFALDIEAGIKHLLDAEIITDKDIAIAFNTTQKRIREIRKSLNS